MEAGSTRFRGVVERRVTEKNITNTMPDEVKGQGVDTENMHSRFTLIDARIGNARQRDNITSGETTTERSISDERWVVAVKRRSREPFLHP